MQPATGAPREDLTSTQVENIISASGLSVKAGLERVDASGNIEQDISGTLLSGTIERSNYATIHGSCKLELTAPLNWGSSEVRPYLDLTAGGVTARFHLGVYRLSGPESRANQTTYSVTGEDRLSRLDVLVGETYRVASGANITDTVKAILTAQAPDTAVSIEDSTATFSNDVVIPLDDKTTWLNVINNHLGKLGYRGLWADWAGSYRSGPYQAPGDRGIEYTYTTDISTTVLGESRVSASDLLNTPNRWVIVPTAAGGGVSDETDVYEFTNLADGPTSVEARGGLVKTAVHFIETEGSALERQATQIIEGDSRKATSFQVDTFPNPLHWHFDVLSYDDPALQVSSQRVLSQSWSLPLDGSDMTHTWKAIS